MPILLNELIQNYKSLMLGSTPPELINRVLREQALRRESLWFKSALRTGSRAPDVTLSIPGTAGSGLVSLRALTASGPVLLKFYRGRWCPFCTLELKAYEKLMPALHKAGVRLIAITGESPEEIALTRHHDSLSFDIVHDAGLKIADEFGLSYALGPAETELYQRYRCRTDQCTNGDPMTMALPALYLIGNDRFIRYSNVSADTSERAEPAQVLRLIEQNGLH